MHRSSSLLALALLGCASTGSSPDPDVRPERGIAVMDTQVLHLTDGGADRATVAAPPEKVWGVLLALYPKMGIPLATIDQPNGRLGNPQLRLMRTLMKERVSSFLNCGSNMTGLKADNDRVTMSVFTTVRPAPSGSGTQLITQVQAESKPVDGTSTDASPCGSTGALERRIAESVGATLGAPVK